MNNPENTTQKTKEQPRMNNPRTQHRKLKQ